MVPPRLGDQPFQCRNVVRQISRIGHEIFIGVQIPQYNRGSALRRGIPNRESTINCASVVLAWVERDWVLVRALLRSERVVERCLSRWQEAGKYHKVGF